MKCGDCKFYSDYDGECRRRAPVQSGRMDYYYGELLRTIAHSLAVKAKVYEQYGDDDDINIESTEAFQRDRWPNVKENDWCGEYEEKK